MTLILAVLQIIQAEMSAADGRVIAEYHGYACLNRLFNVQY